jgi:Uma2 family endonuclease
MVIAMAAPASAQDELADHRAKLEEYLACGARLGWLLDPEERRAYVYRPARAVEILDQPLELSGDPELGGFVLDLRSIW